MLQMPLKLALAVSQWPGIGRAPWRGGGGWHEAMLLVSLWLAAPIGLSPLCIPTLCRSEPSLVVSKEPLDDVSCLTIPGSAVPKTGYCPRR